METAILEAVGEDACSVEELVAKMTGTELLNAQRETSLAFNAQVIAKAIDIVQRETRISTHQLVEMLGVSKNSLYRWARGEGNMSHKKFQFSMERLAMVRARMI